MKTAITIHTDAGHGWIKVKRRELVTLRIERLISSCSYQDDGGSVYLEEDCDLATYCHARGLQPEGIDWIEINDGDQSPIRRLQPFTPKTGAPVSREEFTAHMNTIHARKATT